jgi:nitrite reductase/ring-hydroxylating ferredoxin subunit
MGGLPSVVASTIRAGREAPVQGLSRRALLRRSIGLGIAIWLAESAGATLGFLWSSVATSPPLVRIGTLADLIEANGGLPIADGFPAYVPQARAFVMVLDPAVGRFIPGRDETGDGSALNVRALSQVCPHLGCRPNPCPEDFWFRCPCHQSRYDRLGIKAEGTAYGPADRSMDRFPIEVDARGVLTIDTSKVIAGPNPVPLGQPGIIPPLVENGCFP